MKHFSSLLILLGFYGITQTTTHQGRSVRCRPTAAENHICKVGNTVVAVSRFKKYGRRNQPLDANHHFWKTNPWRTQ